MSEKLQHTATRTRELMMNRYGDGLHHKHNKCHLNFRLHYPTYPSLLLEAANIHKPTTHFPAGKIRKFRQRIAKGRFH